MDALAALLLILLSFAIAFSVWVTNGSASEKSRIVEHCDRIGSVIIDGKVYECRLKQGDK